MICTTLSYNKDVVVKGFLRRHKRLKLNHVTLKLRNVRVVMFLFYTSSLAYTLTYKT